MSANNADAENEPEAKPKGAASAVHPAEQSGVSCYVVWLRCEQNGGCPGLASADVTTSARDIHESLEDYIHDEQIAGLLLDCRPEFEIRVVRAGKITQTIDLYPFLSATMDDKSYSYAEPDETSDLRAAVVAADGDPEDPCWETDLDWERLAASLPALVEPLAQKGKVVCFDDPALPRKLLWGYSDGPTPAELFRGA